MNKETVKKYEVVFFLILVVVVLTVVKIKYGWRGEEAPPLPTAVPTEAIVVTPTVATSGAIVVKVDETKYPLWQDVPYSGDGFLIDKYLAPKVLGVQLEGASTSSATKAVNAWLKTFGDAGKGHKIEFEN
jgi:hypothetical protein